MKKTEFKLGDITYCAPMARTIGIGAYTLCEASPTSAEHEGVEEDGDYDW